MTANERLADQKNFYVSVSRARDEAILITDRPSDLAERLETQTGEKISALEAWIEADRESRHEEVQALLKERFSEKPKADRDRDTASPESEKDRVDDQDVKDGPDISDTRRDLQEAIEDLKNVTQKQRGEMER